MIVIEHDALIGNVAIVLMPHLQNSLTDSEHGKFYFIARDDWNGFSTMMPGQRRFQGTEKTFSIAQKNSRHWHCFAHFRCKILAKSSSLEIINITMRIFPAIHVNTTLQFDGDIFG